MKNLRKRSKVARLEEESAQSKVKFAGGIVKAFEDLERKSMKTGSLTLLDEELGASVEKLSDQLYKKKYGKATVSKHSGIPTTIGGRNN